MEGQAENGSNDTNDSSEKDDVRGQDDLSSDYSEIASLVAQLDVQVEKMVGTMNGLVESIPSHDALSEIWDEQAKVARQGDGTNVGKEARTWRQEDILGDEAKGSDHMKLL